MDWEELQPILAKRLYKRWHKAYNADDLIQIGMVEAYKTFNRFSSDVDLKYLTWKAHQRIKDYYRKEYRILDNEVHSGNGCGSITDDYFLSGIDIPDSCKKIAELISNGFTISEAAKKLKMSKAAVSRQLQKLRDSHHKKLPGVRLVYIKGDITKRQLDILKLVVQGHSHASISEKLFISRRTVDWHMNRLYRIHGASSSLDLILKLIGAGYIGIEPSEQ